MKISLIVIISLVLITTSTVDAAVTPYGQGCALLGIIQTANHTDVQDAFIKKKIEYKETHSSRRPLKDAKKYIDQKLFEKEAAQAKKSYLEVIDVSKIKHIGWFIQKKSIQWYDAMVRFNSIKVQEYDYTRILGAMLVSLNAGYLIWKNLFY